MPKGWATNKDHRGERDGMIKNGDGMAWAISNRPGAAPINGGKKRRMSIRLASVYSSFKHQQRKDNARFKLGRHTIGSTNQPKETLSERSTTDLYPGNRAEQRARAKH